MTTTALLFLVLAIVLVWGGLVASILRLRADGRREAEVDEVPGAPDR